MAPGLCENCHLKPKFGTHKFCGKTCAAQAAAKPARPKQPKAKPAGVGHKAASVPQKAIQLCDYCGQKPKFSNFDYCGKSCATLAYSTQTKQPMPQVSSASKQKTTRVPGASQNVPAAVPPVKTARAPQVPAPRDDSSEEDEEEEEEEENEEADTDLDVYPSDSEEEPAAPAPAAAQPAPKNMPRGGKSNGPPKTTSGTCAIPGCGKASHVDRNGGRTYYCSIKHREEAVILALEAACIMCQRYPQSTSDYFCSSACRNQSMTKT
ncbi:hypothetical protein BS17DRAFT_716140 [Gyrodon lividus]|nr:hypothetical protein BS17DRAFT_716140 [Gyrodon lividus]